MIRSGNHQSIDLPVLDDAAEVLDALGSVGLFAFGHDRLDGLGNVALVHVTDVSDLYPWITVKIVGAKDVEDNNDIKQAINSGTPPDVVISPFPQDVARFCDSGGWIDLNPYVRQEKLDLSKIIPAQALAYTSYNGIQCALPVLSDAYGLYYNVDMLQAKGFTKPPQTISELTTMAKKLTEFNPDGSLKVVGWMPLLETFYENQAINFGHAYAASWYDGSGT